MILRIEYRTAPSFLVAYAVSLSRGGVFVETDRNLAIGANIEVQLAIPVGGVVDLAGTVRYRRSHDDEEGPAGLGVEIPSAAIVLADVVDRLALTYSGVSVMLLAGGTQDRSSLARQIKSILRTADVVSASDARLAEAVLDDDIDLAVLDADYDLTAAVETARLAAEMPVPVPTVALASDPKSHERLYHAGATDLATNPPPFAELKQVIVRALGRPRRVS